MKIELTAQETYDLGLAARIYAGQLNARAELLEEYSAKSKDVEKSNSLAKMAVSDKREAKRLKAVAFKLLGR